MTRTHRLQALALIGLLALSIAPAATEDTAAARAQMLQDIERSALRGGLYTGSVRLDAAVMSVMGKVPRHRFVPDKQQRHAYDNRPLPIGHGQTISQPYIVALMTDLLQPSAGDKVLEIGAGSGYQAAVLAELVEQVYTIEIVPPLGEQARQRFADLGYDNIETRIGDGYHGWPEQAPFDGIIVTAAASHIPPPLVQQLKPGGRMVIPVGPAFAAQTLMLVEKNAEGRVSSRELLPVRFVPLTGQR